MLRWLKKKQNAHDALQALDAKLPRSAPAPEHPQHMAAHTPAHHETKHTASSTPPPHPRPPVHADLDARASDAFYLADGSSFWTLGEFGDALITMTDGTFAHHVHDDTNHFANWIEGCFGAPNKELAAQLRGATRQEMIKLLLPKLEERHPPHALEPATEHLPATVPHQEAKHEVAPPVMHETYAHKEATHHHAKQEEEHLSVEIQPAMVAEAIHARPLPPSPLDEKPDARTKHMLDKLHAIELEASVDPLHAREEFIETRTKVWSDLSDDERKLVLPTLRSVYEALLKHPVSFPQRA